MVANRCLVLVITTFTLLNFPKTCFMKVNSRNAILNISGKPCVYVGMTGLNPDIRFDKHKAGIQSNRYVKQYGLRLLPDLYEGFNPLNYDEAVSLEIEVGIDLRSAGFGVWQA